MARASVRPGATPAHARVQRDAGHPPPRSRPVVAALRRRPRHARARPRRRARASRGRPHRLRRRARTASRSSPTPWPRPGPRTATTALGSLDVTVRGRRRACSPARDTIAGSTLTHGRRAAHRHRAGGNRPGRARSAALTLTPAPGAAAAARPGACSTRVRRRRGAARRRVVSRRAGRGPNGAPTHLSRPRRVRLLLIRAGRPDSLAHACR